MIQIHTSRNIDITKNGIIINPISCEINPVLNGENELVMEFAIDDDGLYKYIQNNNFISVPTPDFQEDQLYRIYDTKKSMSGNKITAYARHVQFDLAKKVIFNKTLNNANGQQALDVILANTGFTGHSNITIQNTIQYKLRNAMNAINGNEEDSFTSCYGGEISCNNYNNLTINTKRGSDQGIRVSFGYNLEEVEEDLNFDNVITRLYPYSGDLTLSGVAPYVDSHLISSIGILEDSIEFSDIKVKENPDDIDGFNTLAEAQAEMIRRCNKLFEKGLDKITANYVVKMQDLSKTTEYKRLGYDVLEKICLGDTVHCYNKNIDIEVEVRCISYKWDCVNEEYIEIELGQFIPSYVEMQNKKIDDTKAELKDDIKDANEKTEKYKVVFEKKDAEIELSVTNLEENTTAKFLLTDKAISEMVKNSEFESYRIQTAKEISERVAKGEFGSLIVQHFDEIIQAINDDSGTHSMTLNGNGVTIANGALTVEDSNGKILMHFDNSKGILGTKDLSISNTEKGSSFYNTLMGMDEVWLKKLSVGKFVMDENDFYIYHNDQGGYDLEDYVETICYKMLQNQGLIN